MTNTPPIKAPALRSVRGLVLAVNEHGERTDPTTIRQWLRLSTEKFKARKVDLYLPEADERALLPLLEEAAHLGLRLSLRCTPVTPPAILPTLAEAGLLDLALDVSELDAHVLRGWMDQATFVGLPLRLFITAEAISASPDDSLMDLLSEAASVQVSLVDSLTDVSTTAALPPDTIEHIISLIRGLRDRGTEIHCLQIPYCQLPEDLWPTVTQHAQWLTHHQYYRPAALEFVRKLKRLTPARMRQAVEIALGEGASFHNRIDDAVLPWVLEHPWYFYWIWFLHKLTRRLPLRRKQPSPFPEDLTELEALVEAHRTEQRKNLGPICAQCRFHPICDHHTELLKQRLPGRAIVAHPGEPLYDPHAFLDPAVTWYDPIDTQRVQQWSQRAHRVEEAQQRIQRERPTREIPAESYEIQDHKTHRMPASVRWFSFSTAELQSTVLARLSPPFTISVTVGGGMAALMGFAFGRHARLMCPMTAFSHKLTLHVDRDGYYVLLRDGEPVMPTAFEDADLVPEYLGTVVEPRIALTNIDGQIVTQTVLLWEEKPATTPPPPCRHSVVIVCTKYARRLQAALLALAHQEGLEGKGLEVLVGYVPGIDATDDVLDSLAAQCPELTIIRMPFTPQHDRAKGFIINECIDLARGAWITLLDADIMLPPDYFARLDREPEDTRFVVPDGRHMLSPETTARVLLGLSHPWADYDALLESDGEYRHHESEGVPPGFCQSVRRAVLEKIRYQELDHFEGSDWWFSAQVIECFGKETRLEGLRVLHLDHGGSQWYGTDRHY